MVSEYQKHISPLFQLIVFCIAVVPLLFFLHNAVYTFNAHDANPELFAHKTAMSSENRVIMGLFISDFLRFDITKNKIVFNGTVWAEFNPGIVSLDMVKEFSFRKGTIIQKGEPIIEKRGKSLFVRWPVRVKLHLDFNYRAFPLDNHTLFIMLVNDKLDASEVQFASDPDNFVLSPEAHLSNWQIIDKHVHTGYSCVQLEEHKSDKEVCVPCIKLALDFRKHDLRHVFSILLPLLLIFFLTLFSFSFDAQKYFDTLISISIGGITALLAYRFVIESLSPDVGYFMLSDYLFILFLMAVFAVFFFNTTILHLEQRAKKIAICLLHLLVVGGCCLLFYGALSI